MNEVEKYRATFTKVSDASYSSTRFGGQSGQGRRPLGIRLSFSSNAFHPWHEVNPGWVFIINDRIFGSIKSPLDVVPWELAMEIEGRVLKNGDIIVNGKGEQAAVFALNGKPETGEQIGAERWMPFS